ncbi:hypothetical protein NHQ30_002136 [Ciborinia camelliae]|nr:hypothetical protein NHQ30_002136 [Ciborinia camelliae]
MAATGTQDPETSGPVADPPSKHVLSVPQSKYTTFDFSPFLTAPAVQHRMRDNRGLIPLISPLPTTRIPSPLAENLHPSVIKDVRDFLLGTGKYTSPYYRHYSGNGKEVWASWKRAWDIWNNHYVEGRVNEVWVAQAYKQWSAYVAQQKKKKKLPFEGPGGRRPLRRKRTRIGKAYRTESKAIEQFEAHIDEVAQGREDFKTRAINDLKERFKANRDLGNGYIEYSEALEEWQRRNWYKPNWDNFKDYNNKAPEYLPLTMDYVYDELYGDLRERVIELLTVDFWRKTPKLEARPGTIEYAIAVAHWEMQAEVRRCRYTERPQWNQMKPDEDLEEKYIQSAIKRTSPAVIEEFRECMEKNRKLGIGYIEYSWQEAHYNINLKAYQGKLDPAIRELEKPDPKDYLDKARPGKVEESTEPVTAIDREEDYDDQDEDDIDPNDLTRPLPIDDDGSSGGFFAMKNFSEYAVPDEDDASFQEYYDPIENSVWRPIQVDEKKVKIDMDEDTDKFLKNSQFEIDGGVDCGRSPYPVLRPLYRYAQSQVAVKDKGPKDPSDWYDDDLNRGSLLKLKKYWDKVTRTVFNIPTKSVDRQTLDKIRDRDHRESFENNSNYQNPDIFPLDIRRCKKILAPFNPNELVPKAPEFRDADRIIEPSFKMNEKQYRPMRFDDPWWIERQQKFYRDYPPRTYPPKFDETQSHLPKDVKLWKDEVEDDSDLNNRYFVANLDGRLLIVNGIEVGKGEIAGPLPEFAIIQTEGGGVSFWFGPGGRFYLQPAGARTKNWSRQWSLLRRTLNDEYFGVASGYFWQNAIVRKILEDDEGEGEQDPKWARWKAAKPERLRSVTDPRDNLDHDARSTQHEDWGAPGPLPFETPEAELKWVAEQLHFQDIVVNEPWLNGDMVEPTGDTAWGGLRRDYRNAFDGPTDDARNNWWEKNKLDARKVQTEAGQLFLERQREEFDAAQGSDEAASLKRKAEEDGYFPPSPKRIRESIEEGERDKIYGLEKEEQKQQEMDLQNLIAQINRGAQKIAGVDSGERLKKDEHWRPGSVTEAGTQATDELLRVRELERLRILFNQRRRQENEIPIPPMEDPIAGLPPSAVLTLPDNRWALEAILKHREDNRLEQETQERAALNSQNASERKKRKRMADRRKLGSSGFTHITDAEREKQETLLKLKAQEEKEKERLTKMVEKGALAKAKKKQAEKDDEFAKQVKSGIKAGDVAKAEATAKQSEKEAHEAAKNLAEYVKATEDAKALGITDDQLEEYTATGREFNLEEISKFFAQAASGNTDNEIREAIETAAGEKSMTVTEYCRKFKNCSDIDEYLEKVRKKATPLYVMSGDLQEAKRQYAQSLLHAATAPGDKKGEFNSWDEFVSSMPFVENWDDLVNSDPTVEPTEFEMVPRTFEANLYSGISSLWVGYL